MLIRCFKFLQPKSSNFRPPESKSKDVEFLSQLNSFTPDKTDNLIKSLSRIVSIIDENYFISKRPNYQTMLSILPQNLISLIPELGPEPFFQIFSLVSQLKINDPVLLASFTKTFISSHLANATLPNIVKFLSGYSYHQDKNTELWFSIENKIDELVYSKGGSITFPALKTVIKSFADNNQGSVLFREKLLENLIRDLNHCATEFSTDIAIALLKMNIKEKAYIEPFFNHVLKSSTKEQNAMYNKLILSCIQLDAGNKILKALEKQAKGKLKEISLWNMNEYISIYRDFAKDPNNVDADRRLFLGELESVYEEIYAKNVELSEKKKEGVAIHIRALNVFLKAGVVKNDEFWHKVFKDIQNFSLTNEDKALGKLISNIEATYWAKEIR